MRSKQYFTSIKNNPHEISTDPEFNSILQNQFPNAQKNGFNKFCLEKSIKSIFRAPDRTRTYTPHGTRS